MSRQRSVGVNEDGHVVGQDHHNAKLSDHEIDLIRDLRAEGMKLGDLADKFETSKGRIHDICSGRRRGHTATGQRTRGALRFRFKAASLREFAYVTDADPE